MKLRLGLLALVCVAAAQAAEPEAPVAREAAPAGSPFGQFDRDGDQRLCEEEMRNGMAGIYAAYDLNNDGALDSTELPDLRDPEGKEILDKNATRIEDLMRQAPVIFGKLDRDSDGYLTKEEFAAAGGKAAGAKTSGTQPPAG